MKKGLTSSLIIATYNNSSALELSLLSVLRQSVSPLEVLIADDGSTEETKDMITEFQKKFSIPLLHIWHKDDGFRKTIILNEAIARATAQYIIQIDGDIIIHKHFIKNHLSLAKPQTFIEGSRVWLNKRLSLLAQKNKIIDFRWFTKGIKNRFNAMYIPFLTRFFTKPTQKIKAAVNTRGCNMSFWKKDFILVNGYNEDMTGWGREDSEICVRLVNAGIIKRNIKFSGIQFHQFHPINSRDGLNKNDKILQRTIDSKEKTCKNGLTNH
jgi:hypothetical protein